MILSDHMSLLYGRENEIAHLQAIAAAVIQKGEFIVDYSLNNVFVDKNDYEGTQPTECTSNSEEDSFANETSAIRHRKDDFINSGGEGGCHFVLVSGRPGTGKRSLVSAVFSWNKIRKSKASFIYVSERFQSPEGSYASTTNHSKKSMSPRRPFKALQAFHDIVRLATQNFEMSTAIEQKLKLLLDSPDDASALCELVPGAKKWLQVDTDAPDSPNSACVPELSKIPPSGPGMHSSLQPTQAWVQILQKFLVVIVSVVPVVILLEDAQYADEISLALIKSLIATNENRTAHQGLMIVATHNDLDGALSSNTLLSSLESFDGNGVKPFDLNEMSAECVRKPLNSDPNVSCTHCTYHIIVSELSWGDVREWVHSCGGIIQQCSAEQKIEISNLVFHHSNGNPLHIRYLLLFLEQDESLLQDQIYKKRIPYKIDDLFTSILLQQDMMLQKVVQVISLLAQYCEGDVNRNVVDIAMNLPCSDIIEAACWLGLIECSSTRPTLFFCRESFQRAAYCTITDVSSLYLDIGRSIWRNAILSQGEKKESDDEDIIARVLLSTQLLRNFIALLSDVDERIYMSQLCYETGLKSSSLGDFKTSSKLFEFAIGVLGSELWRHDLYEASLVLHNAAAQSYCSIADYGSMQKTLDDIFDRASTFQDKLAGYVVLLYAYASQNKLLDLFRTASMVLNDLGEPINSNPGKFTVIVHLLQTKWALRGKDDRFFSDLPIVENAEYFILTQLLSLAMYHSYIFMPNAGLVLCFRLVRLSIKYGLTGPSLHAFTCYAFFLCSTGNFEEGYRMGQLSLKYATKCGAWWPRINVLVYGCVNPWSCPFHHSLEPLNRARLGALTYGDSDMHGSASFYYLATSMSVGIPLLKLKAAAQLFCQDIAASGQMTPLFSILSLWSVITGLLGEEETLDLGGVVNDASSALKYCIKEGNKYMAGNFYAYRTMWYCLIGQYEEALKMAKKTFEQRQICDYMLTFYEGLAVLALSRNSTSCLTHRLLRRGKKLSKCVKSWADRCPENFRNKQWLLEAEIAALKGKSVQALSLFEQSIGKAKKEGIVHEEAIAYERLGRYLLHMRNVSKAKSSLTSARSAYEKWGASVLVDHMNELLALTFSS
jgi:predicted ATPase